MGRTKRGECDCCGTEGIVEEFQNPRNGVGGEMVKNEYCRICSDTFASSASRNQNCTNMDVIRVLCGIGNIILAELRKRK
jgi:hypothetical protein